jgi:hypothetical protein
MLCRRPAADRARRRCRGGAGSNGLDRVTGKVPECSRRPTQTNRPNKPARGEMGADPGVCIPFVSRLENHQKSIVESGTLAGRTGSNPASPAISPRNREDFLRRPRAQGVLNPSNGSDAGSKKEDAEELPPSTRRSPLQAALSTRPTRPIHCGQHQDLERRLAEADQDPTAGAPWQEARERIRQSR